MNSSHGWKDFNEEFLSNFGPMKSAGNVILLAKMLSRFCIVILLLLAYLVNLAPEASSFSPLDSAEKTITFNEADADLSSDFELDLVDDMIIKPVYPDLFLGFLSAVTEARVIESQTDFTVHLEILTPPPRLNS